MFLQDNSGGGPKDLNDAINSAIQYTKELRSAIFEFDSAGETYSIFWKIDLYDLAYNMGSDDPANVDATRRVLTVLHASEY